MTRTWTDWPDVNFTVVQGDIAVQSIDALVNITGTSLRMESGVASVLCRDGGPELSEAAMAKGPIDLGVVAVADTFDLDAEVVIHVTAISHDGSGQATAVSIRNTVSVPMLCEGGIRECGEIDRLLGDACDIVGTARPFYVESEPPARLLGRDVSADMRVVCESCSNCAVLQVTGAPGVCRTPAVLAHVGTLRMESTYDIDAETADADKADSEGR